MAHQWKLPFEDLLSHQFKLHAPASAPGFLWLCRAAEASAELTLLLDRRGRILFANPSALRFLGVGAGANVVGHRALGFVHPDDQAALRRHLRDAQPNHVTPCPGFRVHLPGGHWIWLDGHASSHLHDPQVQALHVQLQVDHKQNLVRQDALAHVTRAMNSTYESSDVISNVLSTVQHVLGALAGSVTLLNAEQTEFELLGQVGYESQMLSEWARFSSQVNTPMTQAVRDRQALYLSSHTLAMRFPEMAQLHAPMFRSAACLPLVVDERVLGVLTLSFAQNREFPLDEREFLHRVAEICAPALDRSRLHRELQLQQQWIRAIGHNSSDIVALLEENGLISFVSNSARRIMGYSEALESTNGLSFVHPEDLAEVTQAFERLVSETTPVTVTLRLRHHLGHYLWFECTGADLRNQPQVGGLLIHARDVNAREEIRAALEASQHDYKRLADHASDLIRQYTLAGEVEYVSPSSLKLLGYTPNEMLGPDPFQFVHPTEVQAMRDLFSRRWETGFEQQVFTYRLRRKDGAYLWFETHFKWLRDAQGEIQASIGTSSMVDARVQAESQLKAQVQRYLQLLEFTSALDRLSSETELINEALRRCLALTEYDYGYVCVPKGTGFTVTAEAGSGSSAHTAYLQYGPSSFAMSVRRSIQLRQTCFRAEDEPLFAVSEVLPRTTWRSLCLVPIVQEGELVNLLIFGTDREVEITAESRTLLTGVVERLSHALDHLHHLRLLNTSREETLRALGLALEYRDYETKGHTDRVVYLTERLGRTLGFRGSDLDALRWGAFLHDTGKVAIPDAILLKPGQLTPEEWAVIKRHPTIGYEMLHHIPSLPASTLEVVLYHQERWNGSGYPNGLQGMEIPLAARVFAIVDVYDALTSERPYKRAWTHQEALAQLQLEAGTLLDERVVRTFIGLFATPASVWPPEFSVETGRDP